MTKKLNMEPFDPSVGRADGIVSLVTVAGMVKDRSGYVPPKKIKKPAKYISALFVDPKKIFVRYPRQRWVEPKRVVHYADNWDPNLAEPLVCRYVEKDDQYFVCNGQHHGNTWLLYYGMDALVPVTGVISDDETIETDIFLGINTGQLPMAPYHTYLQACNKGDKKAIALSKALAKAKVTPSRGKLRAGEVGHFGDLDRGVKYGYGPLSYVLSRQRTFWPSDPIHTATTLGLLELRKILLNEKKFTDDLFDEVLTVCVEHFENSSELHRNIKTIFHNSEITNTGHTPLVSEIVASGIINVYYKKKRKKLCEAPYKINMPVMPKKLINKGYYPKFNTTTYHTLGVYAHVCKTGELSLPWALKTASRKTDKKGKTLDPIKLYEICPVACPITKKSFDYGLGNNNNGTKDPDCTPSVERILPGAKKGEYKNNNILILGNRANRIISDLTSDSADVQLLNNIKDYLIEIK